MTGVRRVLAMMLWPVLFALVTAATVIGAAGSTVLDGATIADTLEDVDFIHRVYGDGLHDLIEHQLADEDGEGPLPGGLGVPTDDASVARIATAVQTMLPESLVEQQVDQLLRQFLPWLTGQRDDFTWTIDLHDPLIETFSSNGSQPSVFESTWTDLGMSAHLLDQLAERQAEDPGPPSDGEPGLIEQLGDHREAVERWIDDALFAFIGAAVPYMAGEEEDFVFHLDFAPYPELAEPLAGPLNTDAETLRTEGWRYDSRDLRRRMAEEGHPDTDIDTPNLAMFRPGGASFTSSDLVARMEAQREADRAAGEQVDGPEIEEVRSWIGRARFIGTWVLIPLVLVTATVIGLLGGHTWRARALWGGSALAAVAALTWLGAVGMVGGTIEGRATVRLDADGDLPAALRAPATDVVESLAHGLGAAMAWRAAAWLVLALAVVGVAAAWPWIRHQWAASHARLPRA